MKILKITFIFCFSLLFCISSALAFDIGYEQTTDDAGLPGEYLTNFGVSARALGMGKAYTAVADDASGPYWNPAGIARMTWKEASFLYSKLFLGGSFNFIGYAHPFLERNVLGVSRVGLDSAEAEKTSVIGKVQGNFQDKQSAYLISYARKLNPNVDAGANIKIITQDIDVYSAIGYGIDLGALYRPPIDNLSLGLSIQNALQPRIKLKEETDVFPMNVKFGIAYKMFDNRLLLATDINYLNLLPDKDLYDTGSGKSLMKWHAGLEYIYPTELVDFAMRAGIDYKEIACGFGLKTRYFILDYAVGLHTLEINHRFSVRAIFGLLPSVEEKQIALERQKLADEKEVRARIISANQYFKEGKFVEAEKDLKRIFELDPENAEAGQLWDKVVVEANKLKAKELFDKGQQYHKEANFEEADKALRNAMELNPEDTKIQEIYHFNQAELLLKQKKYKDAEEALIKVISINSENEQAREMLRKLKEIMEILP